MIHAPRYASLAAPAARLSLMALAAASLPAYADVTIHQESSLKAPLIEIDMSSVERTSSDKQRRDGDAHCRGFMSLFCRDVKSGDIVRLDKQLNWRLEPKKKSYVETLFPTPEQRAQARQQMLAMQEQMKQCLKQTSAAQNQPDTSSCELSKPKVDVKQSDEHLTLAGHDARKTSVVLSQTCTDKETGDVCEIDYGFDTWLTKDEIPGAAEHRAFQKKYLAAQGMDPDDPQVQGAMQRFLAPYGDTLKQLSSRASSLKGYPLRTTFSMSFGGEHCGKAKQQSTTQTAEGHSRDFGLKNLGATAVGSKLAGLFSRRGADAATSAAAGQVGTNATRAAADAASKSSRDSAKNSSGTQAAAASSPMVQVISFTTETKSIDTSSIAADQFEIPAGWKQQMPKKGKDDELHGCPAKGS